MSETPRRGYVYIWYAIRMIVGTLVAIVYGRLLYNVGTGSSAELLIDKICLRGQLLNCV